VRALVLVGALVASVAASGAAAVPAPIVTTGFQTPSGNIVCNAGPASSAPHARPLLACTVLSEATAARGQKLWSLFATGRPLVGFIMGNAATDVPALAYGRLWRWRGFVCASRKAGLTCRNRAAHGFVLSRAQQRVF